MTLDIEPNSKSPPLFHSSLSPLYFRVTAVTDPQTQDCRRMRLREDYSSSDITDFSNIRITT